MTTKITFTLPATQATAEACVLLGDFNNWKAEEGIYLQRQEDGSMTTELELVAGQDYQYRYLLSDGRWVNDDGEKISSDLSGYAVENCIIRVPAVAAAEKKAKVVKPAAPKTKTTKPKAAAKVIVVKEDLTKIEGIGKKIEALLYKSNIQTYQQLSKKSIKAVKEILAAAGNKFSMHEPGTWPKQAKLAAAGKWEELEAWQQELKAGK